MENVGSATLVRICREQAALASTEQVRSTLLELADHYAAHPAEERGAAKQKPDNDRR